jgi:ribonuclease P protein component
VAEAAFPRERRLRKRQEFMHVQNAPAARARAAHFLVLAAWGAEGAPCRLGVVASKKVGGAVRRNRAKRLVREAFRKLDADAFRGVDLVVIAHPSLPNSSEPEIRALLARQLPGLRRDLERRARVVSPSAAVTSETGPVSPRTSAVDASSGRPT